MTRTSTGSLLSTDWDARSTNHCLSTYPLVIIPISLVVDPQKLECSYQSLDGNHKNCNSYPPYHYES